MQSVRNNDITVYSAFYLFRILPFAKIIFARRVIRPEPRAAIGSENWAAKVSYIARELSAEYRIAIIARCGYNNPLGLSDVFRTRFSKSWIATAAR